MPSDILQLMVGGVLLGGIYGLAAFGLSVSFGVLHVLNLAHGEFLMLGSLAAYALFVHAGINPFLATLVIIPVFFLVGVCFYSLLLRPLQTKAPGDMLASSVLVTLGAALVLEDVTGFLWNRPVTGIAYELAPMAVGGVVISTMRVLVLLSICMLGLLLQLFLARTFAGRAIRALTQSRDGARVIGVPIARVSALTFGVGVAVAAGAGAFYVMLFTVTPAMGIPLTVKYLCVVVLGGMGSLVGSLVGGLLLGMAEAFTAYYVGAQWAPCVALAAMLVVLVVRPKGLWGTGVA